jgi:hypothetical protein
MLEAKKRFQTILPIIDGIPSSEIKEIIFSKA